MSKEFEELYKKDQHYTTHLDKKYSKEEYLKTNKKLRKKIKELIKLKKLKDQKDYFITAIIFQHGFNISSSKQALKYSKLAVKKGYKKGKWLIASATDRLFQLQGKPQKFGTQVEDMFSKNWKLYKLDLKTTDEERKSYGLPTLKELKKYYGVK